MNAGKAITLIGSGNVAQQLGPALKRSGYVIQAVFSRNKKTGRALAKKLKCNYYSDLSTVSDEGGILIIAVRDDAISEVAKEIPTLKKTLVVHTSGATDLSILKRKFKNCGVLWQIQTIKARTALDFKKVPIVIEASNPSSRKKILTLAKSLSKVVYPLNSKQRKVLHLSAVWVNNFPNHLFHLAKELLNKNKLPYELLAPLMISTLENALSDPYAAQTGPAKRNDKQTLKEHLTLLHDKNYRHLYTLLSKSITKTHKNG